MLNKFCLQGRLTKEPELRRTQSGTAVASFTVAWSEKYGDTERKLFLPCVAWKGTAELASRHFVKGSEVVVEGQLTSRKWQDRDGNNRETVELTVDRMHFCGSKSEGGRKAAPAPEQPVFAEIEEEDGDLPF